MLTVAKVTMGVAASYAEYLEGKATAAELGDYYLKDGERVEAPGRWVAGSDVVGQDTRVVVGGDVLRALMEVRRPDSGEPLRRVGGTGTAVAAIDATFSAPKSVSAVWALASPPLRAAVEQAHERAVDLAVEYAVTQVAMVRERIDPVRVEHRKARGVIATSWRHTTARAVGDRPPDPQLHSHVLLHAAVRRDGEVVAIDSRSWFVHRREAGAAYRTELAYGMGQLGFEIARGSGRGGRYFEIEGVPQALLDRWSSRHHEVRAAIEARLAATGRSELAPAEDRHMAQSTRAVKGLITHGDLDRAWSRAASLVPFDGDDVERLRTGAAVQPAGLAVVRAGLTEFDATFAEREARAVALEASAGVRIEAAIDVLEQLRGSGELLALANGQATTRFHRVAERQVVAMAWRLAVEPIEAVSPRAVLDEADRLQERVGLTVEQRRALELACSDRRVVMIEGQAGTGKSTALTAIARAHQAGGRELVVISTAAVAAERLARELTEAGVPAPAYSITAFDFALRSGRLELGPEWTVIHDEAALASTREQRIILDAVERTGARLISVGDPGQSQAVGAGGLWPWLETAAHRAEAHAELTRNVRALDPLDRRDQAAFRGGEHQRALQSYLTRGRVVFADEQTALQAAERDRETGKRTLVIAQTSNERLDELNAHAQALRGAGGDRELAVLGRPYGLRAGDEVQVRRTVGGLRNGTAGVVEWVNADQATLRFEDRLVGLDREQIAQADVRLAYVQHPFPAQGQTSDTAHLIVAEHATQEGSYVGLTRAREETTIYTELGEGELVEALARSEPEVPSISVPLVHEAIVRAEVEERGLGDQRGVEFEPTPALERDDVGWEL